MQSKILPGRRRLAGCQIAVDIAGTPHPCGYKKYFRHGKYHKKLMKINDLVRARWYDGLEMVGTFVGTDKGYVILVAENGDKIVCNKNTVSFEVLNESR